MGEVSDVIETQYGWHLIKRIEHVQKMFMMFSEQTAPMVKGSGTVAALNLQDQTHLGLVEVQEQPEDVAAAIHGLLCVDQQVHRVVGPRIDHRDAASLTLGLAQRFEIAAPVEPSARRVGWMKWVVFPEWNVSWHPS